MVIIGQNIESIKSKLITSKEIATLKIIDKLDLGDRRAILTESNTRIKSLIASNVNTFN